MIAAVSGGLATDARSVGPLEYIRALRLQPEDCYGFLPVELSDGSSIVYVYRDRPEYAAAREGLAGPREARVMFGMVEMQHPVEVDLSGTAQPAGEGAIVSHRLYPAIRTRSSGKQLGHFLPRYRDAVGLRPQDVYGVHARGGHHFGGTSTREWDSYWIVYRDRPEYAAGRERYAAEADGKGRWPAAELSPGVGEPPPAAAGEDGKLDVEKTGWPKRGLFKQAGADGLAEGLADTIMEMGHEPEDSFGIAPDFPQRKIYVACLRR